MCVSVCISVGVFLTSLAVRALLSLGLAVVTVRRGSGLWCWAGATTVFLLHRGRVGDGALVAVVIWHAQKDLIISFHFRLILIGFWVSNCKNLGRTDTEEKIWGHLFGPIFSGSRILKDTLTHCGNGQLLTDHQPHPGRFRYPPCMSIIPGEELFSGVVNSEPYFSSLPFFLFLFFYNQREGAEFKHTVLTIENNQHVIQRNKMDCLESETIRYKVSFI